MWISVLVLMVLFGICDSFHLQNQPRIRRAVCRRVPPCCPGHVCRAYQRFDASRPVAVCARSLESRPLYAPGSPAQQRICRVGSRGLTGIGSLSSASQSSSRGLPQFRGSRTQGLNSVMSQSQTGIRQGIGREGNRFGPSSRLPWDQMRTQIPQGFPGQPLQVSGQDVRGQSQMGFPEFPPMPSFGSQSPLSDSLPPGLSPDQGIGQTSSFSSMPGQGFGQGQRSFGRIDEQRFDAVGSGRSQGQQGLLGQFPSGQRGQAADASFEQGQPRSSFSGQSFRQSGGSGSLRGQSFGREQPFSGGSPVTGGLPFGSGQTFSGSSPAAGGLSFGDGQSFSGGSPVSGGLSFGSGQSFSGSRSVGGRAFGRGQTFGRGQSLSTGQSLHSGQSFGGAAFGQLPSGASRGGAPQPFLVEQPPITATSISGSQDQSQAGVSQSQPPRP